METRANYVWVGVVTLVLLAAVGVFFVWLARLGNGDRKEYDIFFQQSVGGLADGSTVAFAGVPVGRVSQIKLWRKDPEYVRVRIKVKDDVPILVGTTATISFSFTGVSTLNLDGARRGAPPITCKTTACPEGVPVIPPAAGPIGAILSSAPLLLERLATLADRLNNLLDDQNQKSIAGILKNTNRITGQLAAASPQVKQTMAKLQETLDQSTKTLASFQQTLDTTNALLKKNGQPLSDQLQKTLLSAQQAADSLKSTLNNVQPLTKQLDSQTLPAADAALRDLAKTSKTLRNFTEKLQNQGAGSLIKGQQLPTYKP